MTRGVKLPHALAGLLAFALGITCLNAQTKADPFLSRSTDQIHGQIAEADTVTLRGNVHPLVRPENDRGAVDPSFSMPRIALLLQPSPERQAAAANFAAAQQNPASPYYHKWITTQEYAERFGASSGDIAVVQAWLRSHGFTVDEPLAGHRLLYFSGNAGQVSSTFHTEIHKIVVNGEEHFANVQDPQIPRALAAAVAGIVSLHNFTAVPLVRVQPLIANPTYTTGTTHYLYPSDYGVIYGLSSVWSGGNTGTGVTIGIVGRSSVTAGDISTFRTNTGLSANSPTLDFTANGGSAPTSPAAADTDEATLDVEWAGAVAPSATILLEPAATSGGVDGIYTSAAYLVNTISTKPAILSVSFGECEQTMGSTLLASWNTLWEQAATQGQTVLVSSGDSGAAGCSLDTASSGSEAGVNGLCTSQYSTCVGGTMFNDTASPSTYWSASNGTGDVSAISYIPENVWNESALNGGSDLYASGGGISQTYTEPSWQDTLVTVSEGQRAVPDVALSAAAHDGYYGYLTSGGSASAVIFSGTSAAAPSFAGIMALVDKSFTSVTKQGNINPVLYGLASGSNGTKVFHETVSGDNTVTGVGGYAASSKTYNLATGLGSVNGANLITYWKDSSGLTSFSLSAASSSKTIATGSSATDVVTVTSIDGVSAIAAMTATVPTGFTVTYSPSSVTATSSGATTTATIAVGSTVQPGNYVVVLNGTYGSIVQSTTIAVTVTAAPTLSVQGASNVLQITQGASQTVTNLYTVTTGSTFSGTVSLAVSGLPTGVTGSFSTLTISSNTGTSTLTLTGSASDVAGALSTVTVTATGDSVTATTTFTLEVMAGKTVALKPTSSTLSMNSTGTVTDVITVATEGGLSGAVTLSASGLPTGVTASFSSSSISSPGSGQSTVTFTGSSSATSGTTTVTITGSSTVSGTTYTGTTTIALTVARVAPGLAFLGTSARVSVQQGSTTTTTVTVMTTGAFSGNVSLAVTGLPSGVTGSWSSSTVTPSSGIATSTLTLTASASATVSSTATSATITATGVTDTTATATETMPVTVTYSSQILATSSSSSITMASDATVTDTITIQGEGGFTAASVTLTLPSNIPTGITASYSSNVNTSTGAVTLSSGAATITLTLTGSINAVASASRNLVFGVSAANSASVTKTSSLTIPLIVTLSPPTLSLSAASTSLSLEQGKTVTDVITITAAGSFATGNTAALSVSGLPTGVSASWSSATVTPALNSATPPVDLITSTLTLTATSQATVSTSATDFTITAKGNSPETAALGTLSIPLTMSYAPGILIVPTTSTVTMASAGTATNSIKVTDVGGLTPSGTVALTVSGLPSGITGSFGTITSGASLLTLTGSHTATSTSVPDTVTVTATAEDSSGNFYVNTGTFSLDVTLTAPTITVSPASATASLTQGSTVTDVVTFTTGGSFNSSITPTVSGLPTGVSATWSTSPVVPTYSGNTGTGTSTLTLTATSTATVPSSATTVTITATGDGVTKTTTIALTMVYSPAVELTVASSTKTIGSATTATDAITVLGVGGVATTGATLAASGLPTGVTAVFSPATLTSTGASTLTFTSTNAASAGTYPITVTASQTSNSTTYTATATIALTVTQSTATLTLSPASATKTLSIASGTATDVITLTGGGSYSGNVTLAVSGLPTGVTASWSANPATMTYSASSGTSTATPTLTFTAGGTASASSTASTITITASGDGLAKTTTIALTVSQ